MDSVLSILGRVALYLVLLFGLIAIPLGLSGNFILLGAALLVALITKFQMIGAWPLAIMGGLVVLGEVLEAVLGSLVARRYGASKWGMLGAFAGGVLGAIPGTAVLPVIGSIIGSFVGAAAGAVVAEWIVQRRLPPGMRAGWGAFLGKAISSVIKLAIGVGIVAYIVLRTLGSSGR